ncbi:MAG: hypothetical protein ACK56F_33190, partial [bacterium]
MCLPHPSCAPPSYCEHASVSPQRRRTAAVANSSLQGRLIPSFLVSGPMISRIQEASPASIHSPVPGQCLEH